MKAQKSNVQSVLSMSPKLATALGVAVTATQAESAVVTVLPPFPKAVQGIDNFEINTTGVLVLTHTQTATSTWTGTNSGQGTFAANGWRPNFVTTSWTTVSGSPGAPLAGTWFTTGNLIITSSRLGRVAGASGVNLASARRGGGSFTVNAAMFTGSGVNVAKGTYLGGPSNTTGYAESGANNFIPVKFNLGGGDLYGIAQVEFNEVGTGYVELLNFWYSDNGSPLKYDNGTIAEVSAIPEVGGMVSTALLLGMAAMVRSRRKDPHAGSLAALAAGVGGLMARAHSSEESA